MTEILTEDVLYKKTPQELTSLLYENCIERLNVAITAIQDKNMIEANLQLQRINDILYRLGAGLNYEAGIIADELEAVYDYLTHRIIEANIMKNVEILLEVREVLTEITNAWNVAVSKKAHTSVDVLHMQRTAAYDR